MAQELTLMKTAAPSIFILLFIGIILGVGATTLLKIQGSSSQAPTFVSTAVINESLPMNGTALSKRDNFAVANANNIDNASVRVWNFTATDGWLPLTPSTHFNVLADGTFNVSLVAAAGLVQTDATAARFNVSYNYTDMVLSIAYNVTEDGLGGLDSFSDFQPTMAVVVVLVVIVGLLLGGFASVMVLRRREF